MKTKELFRTECNHGSKYFTDIAEAFEYFYKCLADRKSVEIWRVITVETPNKKSAAVQELLDSVHFK